MTLYVSTIAEKKKGQDHCIIFNANITLWIQLFLGLELGKESFHFRIRIHFRSRFRVRFLYLLLFRLFLFGPPFGRPFLSGTGGGRGLVGSISISVVLVRCIGRDLQYVVHFHLYLDVPGGGGGFVETARRE